MPRPTATVSVVGGGDVKASVAVNINGDEVVNSALPPMQQPASAVMTVVGENIGQEQRLRDVTPAVPQMDLESISKKDLMQICGIGHKLSKRLIDAREFQPFQSWEDVIRRVDLISTKRVELLQKHMKLRRCEWSSPE